MIFQDGSILNKGLHCLGSSTKIISAEIAPFPDMISPILCGSSTTPPLPQVQPLS